MEINHVEKTKFFDTSKCVESNLGVRSNTSSRTGIGGGAKFYSVRLVVLTVLELSVQF